VVGLAIGTISGSGFDPAHTWFLSHLLVYAMLYSAWRLVKLREMCLPTPGNRAILGYAVLLAGITAMVRMAGFPQDRWVTVLGVVPVEVAHLPQYASLFVIGLLAARARWIERLPTRTGLLWLGVGVVLSVARYLYTPNRELWSLWESFICVGLCVGLPVLFRECVNQPVRVLRAMAPNAFGAYVVHVLPVVVGLQLALAHFDVDPFTKFSVVALVGIPMSFALAAALRRLPGITAVL
jgi:glucan biosynthesis protein C